MCTSQSVLTLNKTDCNYCLLTDFKISYLYIFSNYDRPHFMTKTIALKTIA